MTEVRCFPVSVATPSRAVDTHLQNTTALDAPPRVLAISLAASDL
jgi:hypothetical protein